MGEPEGTVILIACEYPDAYLVLGRITDLPLVAADSVEFHLHVAFAVD